MIGLITGIPKTICQFWDKPDLPDDLGPLVQSWRDLPRYTHHLFNDETARAFLAEHYPATVVEAFDACMIPAMRSDIFRICAILKMGGWYADCSIEALKDPSQLIKRSDGMVYYRRWHGGVNNGLFAAKAGNAHLTALLDTIVSNVKHRVSDNLFLVTGPGVWNARFPKETPPPPKTRQLDHSEIANIYVRFHQDLAHKKDGQHWSDQQKSGAIFRDPA